MRDESGWWGIMGPIPSPNPTGIIAVAHDRSATLDREYQIGPLRIRPGGNRLTEYVRSEPMALDGVTLFETWPVIAEGPWPGVAVQTDPDYQRLQSLPNQDANERVVAIWLHRVTSLLSLAVGEAWQVRTAAIDRSTRPPTVPEDWPPPDIWWRGEEGLDPVPRGLPDWVVPAWDFLTADEKLRAALTVWHQGLLLEPLFPSFAMVAYCGTIETIAHSDAMKERITFNVESCGECGNVPKAQARFWATVGLVKSSTEIEELKKTVNPYGRRSRTAHGSATHGIESMFGSMHYTVFAPPSPGQPATLKMDQQDETQMFMWRDVPMVRAIGADLLRLALASNA